MIRAKFQCLEIAKNLTQGEKITLNAVWGNGEANKEWSKWTPSGSLTMQISNPDACGKLEVGKEYYLDITPVI